MSFLGVVDGAEVQVETPPMKGGASRKSDKDSDDGSIASKESEGLDQKEYRVEILGSHYWEYPKGYRNSPSGRIALLVGKLADKRKEHVKSVVPEFSWILSLCRVDHRRAVLPSSS